jgi:hypothetical protein
MTLGKKIYNEMMSAKQEEGATYEEISHKMGTKEKQNAQSQMKRYLDNIGTLEPLEKMASVLNRKIIFRLIKDNSSEVVENEEYFIDRSLQRYGHKTTVMFKSDGYQVHIDAMNLTDKEYIERAIKIRELSEKED